MKWLGQHFLKNTEAVKTIIDALDLKPGETVIEIGPGTGALTIPLAQACAKVGAKLIAIEKDEMLAEELRSLTPPASPYHKGRFGGVIEIITGDALKEIPELLTNYQLPITNYKIVGNIPYYITGHLLRLIGESEVKPATTVLMLQKEVAERVSAQPPKMNLLAAATQVWAHIEILQKLTPNDFDPPPRVESAMIQLTPVNRPDVQPQRYHRAIHAAFKQPRKKLINNLADGLGKSKPEIEELLKRNRLSPDLRAQNLTIEELLRLSKI